MPGILTPHLYIGGGLILGILLISVLWQYKKIVIVGFCLLIFIAGIWRHQKAELQILNSELKKYNNQEVVLNGVVSKEPDIRENHIKLTVNSKQLTIKNEQYKVKGKILVTTKRYPEYQYGDELEITGELLAPQEFEEFDYKNYLAKDGICLIMYYPKIEILTKNQGNIIYSKILQFKNKLRKSIEQNLSPPQRWILGAMILGDKKKMSKDFKERLNIVGLRHITAVSGMHITIFSVVLMQILIGIGFWRQQAFYLTLVVLILFILMIGFPASAIRAGIMGGVFLLAQYLGRLSSSFRTIIFVCTGMLVINPLLLKSDIGFQLSFLAVIGIIFLGPIFREKLKFIPQENFFNLRNIITTTLSAQIFTLPILVYNFGQFSLIAPLTNFLVLPLLPFVLISGFLLGLTGIFWQFLAWILSLPCWLLLTYVTKIVDWFSRLPFSSVNLEISWIWLLIFYIVLGFFVWRVNKNRLPFFLQY